jgi:hypothetical protein
MGIGQEAYGSRQDMKIFPSIRRRLEAKLLNSHLVRGHVEKSILQAYPSTVKMGEFKENDVFVVGYPKSGNTWMQNLLSGLIYGAHGRNASGQLIQELIPDVHYKKYYQRFGKTACFKSHHLPRCEYRRVIYIIRDGRDVLVSYWHYHKNITGVELQYSDLIEMPIYNFGTWAEHAAAWLENPYGADQMFLRYEDLLRDGVAELKKIARFLKIEVGEQQVREVVNSNSFQKLREKEKCFGFGRRLWEGSGAFFRRGSVGAYLDEMPVIAARSFTEQNSSVLRAFGYDCEILCQK